MSDSTELGARAVRYCERHQIAVDLTKVLGFGQDGKVWKASHGTGVTAIKVFERSPNYKTELECYQRLRDNNVEEIEGISVPTLEGFDDALMVIEMSIVRPPYILDFAKAHIDKPFDFEEGGYEEWLEQIHQAFGPAAPRVKVALARLRGLGIYFYDIWRGNIRLNTDPGPDN